jgi:hypothetical protein
MKIYGDLGNRCENLMQQRYYKVHLRSKTNPVAGRETPLEMYDSLYSCTDWVFRKGVLGVNGRGKFKVVDWPALTSRDLARPRNKPAVNTGAFGSKYNSAASTLLSKNVNPQPTLTL